MQNILFLSPNEATLLQTTKKKLALTLILLFKHNPYLNFQSSAVKISFSHPPPRIQCRSCTSFRYGDPLLFLILKEFLVLFFLLWQKKITKIIVLYSFHQMNIFFEPSIEKTFWGRNIRNSSVSYLSLKPGAQNQWTLLWGTNSHHLLVTHPLHFFIVNVFWMFFFVINKQPVWYIATVQVFCSSRTLVLFLSVIMQWNIHTVWSNHYYDIDEFWYTDFIISSAFII